MQTQEPLKSEPKPIVQHSSGGMNMSMLSSMGIAIAIHVLIALARRQLCGL
jgi:hypothetical protein